jgi:RNA polymerase sigma-70 factor (ECF subfamily)
VTDRGPSGTQQRRTIVYCVVPEDLAVNLHEPLQRHFADQREVEVVVEQRWRDRRRKQDRREDDRQTVAEERRRIRAVAGRRVGERRAAAVPVATPAELPRKARPFAERIVFVERIEPSSQWLEDLDSARLITRFQAGDRDVFADLYLRYFDRVYRYLRVVLRSPEAAEDATQQIFMRLLTALPDYERRRQPFRAWLFTIVRNHAITELNKQRRLDVIDPHELDRSRELAEVEAEELPALDWLTDRELILFVERLPLAQRQVLTLRFLVGLSNEEIASVLGRSDADVRTLQSRGLRFLRERLGAIARATTPVPRARMSAAPRHATVVRARRWALLS